MGRMARACAGILVMIAATLAALVGTATAAAGSCEKKVLLDWSDNGRVDGMYPLECYHRALTSMPSDLRDYTNASDAIQRALASATTRSASSTNDETSGVAAGADVQVGGPGPAEIPLPLIALACVSLAVLAAGSLGWIVRRRRGRFLA
jgi:hypothetical protein